MKNQEIKFKDLNHNYSILIGNNVLGLLPKRVKLLCPKTKKIALIIDKNIPSRFIKILKNKLKNYNLIVLPFTANEKLKSLQVASLFVNKLLSKNFGQKFQFLPY